MIENRSVRLDVVIQVLKEMFHSSHNSLQMHAYCSYIYTVDIYSRYIFIIFINNSRRKDKGNQWHDGSCISGYKILLIYINFNLDLLV